MTGLVVSVLMVSLLGSLHCAGMCGAFLAIAVSPPGDRRVSQAALQVAYHLGRLVTYCTLGACAGWFGSALDMGGSLIGVQRVATILAATFCIGFGIVTIGRLRGIAFPRAPLPARLIGVVTRLQRRALHCSPVPRAAITGLLTTLLPCGWLYAFVIAAGGSASPLQAVVIMTVFWLGTLPVMITLGAGVRALAGRFSEYLPAATACTMIGMGLVTIAWRGPMIGRPFTPLAALATAPSTQAAIEQAGQLERSGNLPCCSQPE